MLRQSVLFLSVCLFVSGCANFVGIGPGTPDGAPAADDPASADARSAISSGFQSLGMEPAKSECYAQRIDARLDGERLDAAAQIVSDADHKDDVKQGVTSAGPDMQNAFLFANLGC